jgi:hypothetical protein
VSAVQVSPHPFAPLRRWFNRGRCAACYVHEHAHPVGGWTTARPWGDKRAPDVLLACGVARKEERSEA